MKKTMVVVVSILLVGSLHLVWSQRTAKTTTLRSVQVNQRSIRALPRTQKFVVDLTQKGVKYELDQKAGKIDMRRVTVRTEAGNFTMAAFLEKNFSKETLAGFKLDSHSFIIGTQPQNPPPTDTASTELKLGFTCGSLSCDCHGEVDCIFLVFRSGRCKSNIICWTDDDGKTRCHCRHGA